METVSLILMNMLNVLKLLTKQKTKANDINECNENCFIINTCTLRSSLPALPHILIWRLQFLQLQISKWPSAPNFIPTISQLPPPFSKCVGDFLLTSRRGDTWELRRQFMCSWGHPNGNRRSTRAPRPLPPSPASQGNCAKAAFLAAPLKPSAPANLSVNSTPPHKHHIWLSQSGTSVAKPQLSVMRNTSTYSIHYKVKIFLLKRLSSLPSPVPATTKSLHNTHGGGIVNSN